MHLLSCVFSFFFFNASATTEIYTLSLHDALPIWAEVRRSRSRRGRARRPGAASGGSHRPGAAGRAGGPTRLPPDGFCRPGDRKSTRLNSSHVEISYAVFCLKKKNK